MNTFLSRTVKHVFIVVLLVIAVALRMDAPPVRADGPVVHVVNYGETLFSLARKYNLPLDKLISLNRLSKDGTIIAGQRLVVSASDSLTPLSLIVPASSVRLYDVPLWQQQQTLTCEEAAAAMALRGRVSESQIVRAMPRTANPFEGIRGRTNAPMWGTLADYGTYAQGLRRGLSRLGFDSTVLYGQSYAAFKSAIMTSLRAGNPVVWWTTFREQWQTPVYIQLPDGHSVKLVRYEHTVTIVGATANGFIYHDPEDGSVRAVSFADHQRTSSYFDNMALIIE